MPRKDNLSPSGNYALASNIATVKTSGLETDIQYTKQFNNRQQVWGTLGLVWLDSKTSEPTPSFYISSHAKFLTNFNLEYSNRRYAISANGVYKHRRPQLASAINAKVDADCFMMNTKAEVFVCQQRMSLFLEADNILDNKCGDLLGSKLPGRWLMGGLKLNFNK
jgi:iron complex outermembrane receptor protein